MTESTEKPTRGPRKTGRTAADLADRLKKLSGGAPPETPEPETPDAGPPAPRKKAATAPRTAREKPTAAPQRARKADTPVTTMPAEQATPALYSERVNLTVPPEQKRALALARVDDGLDMTARIRAMIAIWQDDPRFRARVDKEARRWR